MLPDDDKQYAIETCRSSESVLKKWFKNKLHTISAFVGFVITTDINLLQLRILTDIFKISKIPKDEIHIVLNIVTDCEFKKNRVYLTFFYHKQCNNIAKNIQFLSK